MVLTTQVQTNGHSWSEAASQPTSTIMSSSDLSPRAKLNYESDNFVVEFNVAEYKPEVHSQFQLMLTYLYQCLFK